jgi:hypothetical protein
MLAVDASFVACMADVLGLYAEARDPRHRVQLLAQLDSFAAEWRRAKGAMGYVGQAPVSDAIAHAR